MASDHKPGVFKILLIPRLGFPPFVHPDPLFWITADDILVDVRAFLGIDLMVELFVVGKDKIDRC